MANKQTTIAGYKTSADHKLLASLARKSSVICIVDYRSVDGVSVVREVASTACHDHRGEDTFIIRTRGCSYIYAFSEDEFIKQCGCLNVAFIVPECVDDAQKGGA